MKKKRHRPRRSAIGAAAIAFVAGILVDSWLRTYGPPLPLGVAGGDAGKPVRDGTTVSRGEVAVAPIATTGAARRTKPPGEDDGAPAVVRPDRTGALHLPIDGIAVESLKGGFAEARKSHPHEAVDILSPRNTPVHAVEDGTIAKLFVSKAGGNTIYEFDRTGRYAFYYAHLERYATGLREGDKIKQGQVIGYVGTSGNAPPDTPHLHFAVFELGPERQWWKGKAVDPYPLFR